MNYIRITKENIDKEHICCAMSGKQSVAKKEWLKQRFDDGLVFYRSEERGKCFIEYIPAENAERLIRNIINRDDALIMDDTSCCKRYFICDSTHLFFTELGRKRTYFKRIINYTFISTNVFFPFFFASYMAWSALRINSI